MTSGQTDLSTLINAMEPVLDPKIWVFSTGLSTDLFTVGRVSQSAILMRFVENEGETWIWLKSEADRQSAPYTFESRRITLNIHSSLEAVGFMAAIATALAKAGISCNPVSGFFHDHVFVPADRAEDAMIVLETLSRR